MLCHTALIGYSNSLENQLEQQDKSMFLFFPKTSIGPLLIARTSFGKDEKHALSPFQHSVGWYVQHQRHLLKLTGGLDLGAMKHVLSCFTDSLD